MDIQTTIYNNRLAKNIDKNLDKCGWEEMQTANFLNDLIYFFYDIQIHSNLLKLYFVIN
jgi:hypothetical protein